MFVQSRRPFISLAAIVLTLISISASRAEKPLNRETPVVVAVRNALPSVVNIHSEKTALYEAASSLEPFESGRRINGMGTGVIVDERGYILTNHHVVDKVETISVSFSDKERFQAKVVSTDPKYDLAVVKIEAGRKLPVLPMGRSNDLMLGEPVIALGNAFGYENTVTTGIISWLGRDVEVNETQAYRGLIQTDASINPGNSGGPLMNIDGDWIGLNVAIRAGAQGIGFAIPIDHIRHHLLNLLNTQRISQTWHGIHCRDEKLTLHLTSDRPDHSVRITSIEHKSPGHKAGLRPGDVILNIGGHEVHEALDLERGLIEKRIGSKVTMTIERDNSAHDIELTVEELPSSKVVVLQQAWSRLGIRVQAVGASVVRRIVRRYNGGLQITEIRPGSPAALQGFQLGDTLLGLDLYEVINLSNLDYVLQKADARGYDELRFRILRDRRVRSGVVNLEDEAI